MNNFFDISILNLQNINIYANKGISSMSIQGRDVIHIKSPIKNSDKIEKISELEITKDSNNSDI